MRPGSRAVLGLALLVGLLPVSAHAAGGVPDRVVPPAGPRAGAGCPRAPEPRRRSTRFGSSVSTETLSFPAALGAAERRFGRLGVVRVFDPGVPPPTAWERRTPVLAGRAVATSFRMPPRAVLAGRYDAAMLHFFTTAPRRSAVYWTYWHEPEPDIAAGAFTARQYKRAWRHLAGLARQACNPRLFPTLVLTGWTAEGGSGRSWRRYYPGRRSVSVLGWDPYNAVSSHPRAYQPPRRLFAAPLAASRAAGKPFAVAETGSVLVRGDTGVDRAGWLLRVGRFTARHRAAFVAYYDTVGPRGLDFRLTDTSSAAAWARVVR